MRKTEFKIGNFRKILIASLFSSLFIAISAFPINTFDFRLPTSSSSPIEAALGGLNVTSGEDYYLIFSNPALIRQLKQTNFSISFALLPDNYDEYESVLKTHQSLQDNNLRGMAFQTRQFTLGYQVLAQEKWKRLTIIENDDADERSASFMRSNEKYSSIEDKKTYQNYKLNMLAFGIADSVGVLFYGFTGKFLYGRMVYLEEKLNFNSENEEENISFIDSSAWGYSFDLGLNNKSKHVSYGIVFYDIYSKVDWDKNPKGKIKPRLGMGTELYGKNYSYGIATNSKAVWKQDPFYSFFYTHKYFEKNKQDFQTSVLRLSATSKNFKSQENTFFNIGFGYYIKIIRVDIALQSKGMKSDQTQYIMSFTLGE